MATALVKKHLFHLPFPPNFHLLRHGGRLTTSLSTPSPSVVAITRKFSSSTTATSSTRSRRSKKSKEKPKLNTQIAAAAAESLLKRRTRSGKEFDEESVLRYGDSATHTPVMLGEVLEVFASLPLCSFVDCTLGAAGHSSAIIQAHPEMKSYVGLDVDPVAHEKAQAQINMILHCDSRGSTSDLQAHTLQKNFKDIKSVLYEVDEKLQLLGVDGILMDLGISSMQVNNAERGFSVLNNGPLDMRMNPQASLKAEDILNSWPDAEVGRILREYGEESNWRFLQNKIVKARLSGGLHSTGELVELVQNLTSRAKGGRQGWIKTATRVFQALRIAVNDELKTLEDSLYACFECLAPGGRLAVISFHSLEDRIVKQTFLNIIRSGDKDKYEGEDERCIHDLIDINFDHAKEEAWIKKVIQGSNGTILTKRPLTPSEEEEKLNRRSRSAKLRVIQKIKKGW